MVAMLEKPINSTVPRYTKSGYGRTPLFMAKSSKFKGAPSAMDPYGNENIYVSIMENSSMGKLFYLSGLTASGGSNLFHWNTDKDLIKALSKSRTKAGINELHLFAHGGVDGLGGWTGWGGAGQSRIRSSNMARLFACSTIKKIVLHGCNTAKSGATNIAKEIKDWFTTRCSTDTQGGKYCVPGRIPIVEGQTYGVEFFTKVPPAAGTYGNPYIPIDKTQFASHNPHGWNKVYHENDLWAKAKDPLVRPLITTKVSGTPLYMISIHITQDDWIYVNLPTQQWGNTNVEFTRYKMYEKVTVQ